MIKFKSIKCFSFKCDLVALLQFLEENVIKRRNIPFFVKLLSMKPDIEVAKIIS